MKARGTRHPRPPQPRRVPHFGTPAAPGNDHDPIAAGETSARGLERLRRWVKRVLFHVVARKDPQRYIELRCTAMSLLGRVGAYERAHLNYLRHLVRPGALVVDVGAHFGIYTEALCSLVGTSGKVHAFEPQARVFNALRRLQSSHNNLDVHRVALSSRTGTSTLRIPFLDGGVPEPALATLEPLLAAHETDEIATRTLDSYRELLPGLAFVKVDVEGHETEFLDGAREVLASSRPVVQIEDNSGGRRLAHYLHEGKLPGYALCTLAHGELRELGAATGRGQINFYLVPRDRGSGAHHHAGPRGAVGSAAGSTR
jgi:FkbM family methyltransferase